MAGCDYLPSIKGIGLIKALGLFKRFMNLNKVIGHLQYNRAYMEKIPDNYEEIVKQVATIFQY